MFFFFVDAKEMDEVVSLIPQEYVQRKTGDHFNVFVIVVLKDIVEGECGPKRARASTE